MKSVNVYTKQQRIAELKGSRRSSRSETMVYFMKYYMNFNETQESLAFLFLFACTTLWIPVINKLSSKYGKREASLKAIL